MWLKTYVYNQRVILDVKCRNWSDLISWRYIKACSSLQWNFSFGEFFYLVSTEFSIKNAVEICKNYLSTISRSRDFNVFMNKLLMNCNDWLKIEFNPSLWKGRPTEVSNRVKSQTLAPKASLINLGYRLLMSNMLKLKRKRPITTTSQNHSDDQNTQL